MCTIMAAGLGLLGIGSSVAGYAGQVSYARSQAKYQNRLYSETARLATENYIRATGQLYRGTEQQHAQTGQMAERQRLALQREAAAQGVRAMEAGVGGNTLAALFAEYNRLDAETQSDIHTNRQWMVQQAGEEAQGLRADAAARIAGAAPGPVPMPSLLGTMLQIGTTALSSYDLGMQHLRRGPYNPNAASTSRLYQPILWWK